MNNRLIKVRAKTAAKRNSLSVVDESTFLIEVKEKPERNLANTRIIHMLAEHLKIPTSKIRITKGHHSPSKILSIIT